MIDLNLAAVAAEMRGLLAASNGGRRCAARGLESGHHLTLFRLPDRSIPTVVHYRLEAALHHLPPFPDFLDAAAAFGAAGRGEWTVRGGWTDEGVRLWTAWRCWFEDEGQGDGDSCERGPSDSGPAGAGPTPAEPTEGGRAD